MAGKIIVSTLQSDTDNSISFVANTGATIFSANISHGIAGSFIANGSITGSKIALGTITGDDIATGQITGNLLTANCVSGNNIVSSPTITGNVTINGSLGIGGATPASSGFGITFPGTQVASTDANTLDDYEEGTWTPVVQGVGGSIGSQAYSIQAGRYIKIGRFVLLTGYLVLTNKGSWTGDAEIRGFPFTVTNETASYSAHNFYYGAITLPANNFALGAYVNIGSTSARLFSSNNTGTTNSDYSVVNNSTQIGPWQFCYFTSA